MSTVAISRLRRRSWISASSLGWTAFALVLGYLVVLPLVRLQSLAFTDGAAGYRRAYETGAWDTIGPTVTLALGSMAIALVLGTSLAWASTRLPRRLGFLRSLPVFPIVIPAVAAVTGWSFLLSPRPGYLNAVLRQLPWWSHLTEGPVDIYSITWIVILTGFMLTSFVYLFVAAGLQNIGTDVMEAATISGAGQLTVFFKVVLPLLRPVLIYGGGVALLLGLGQFTAPLLLGRTAGVDVLTTEMYRAVAQIPSEYGAAAAIGSPLLIFGVIIVVLQKVLLGDQSRFVTHGGKGFRAAGRPSRSAAVFILTYFFIATVLPLVGLAIVAASPFWTGSVRVDLFTLNSFRRVFDTPAITEAIFNSVTISLVAVLIALPVGFGAASLLYRGRRHPFVRTVVDLLVTIPLGLPAVVFGVGFLLAYSQGPLVLYGTHWVMVLVYVTLMLPFSTRLQLSSMMALGDSYVEAARTGGASTLRTNAFITVPLIRASIGGAAALMFVLLTHEFSASLLVRAPTTQVMGTILYDYWTNGTYPLVAAIALVMTAVTGIGVAIATALAGGNVFNDL